MRVRPSSWSLRTPACPGFSVSGDRKNWCFDRYDSNGAVALKGSLSSLLREEVSHSPDLPQSLATSMTPSFERVQIASTAQGGKEDAWPLRVPTLSASSVQRALFDSLSSRLGAAAESFERVQMSPRSLPDRSSMHSKTPPSTPFEHVQIRRRSLHCGPPRARSQGIFERVQTALGVHHSGSSYTRTHWLQSSPTAPGPNAISRARGTPVPPPFPSPPIHRSTPMPPPQ